MLFLAGILYIFTWQVYSPSSSLVTPWMSSLAWRWCLTGTGTESADICGDMSETLVLVTRPSLKGGFYRIVVPKIDMVAVVIV